MVPRYLIVLSASDPIAEGVGAFWPTARATGLSVEGAPIRELSGVHIVRRAHRHVEDERLGGLLEAAYPGGVPPVVFPSIHRSAQEIEALTVHPLGNPGPRAEVGGRPRSLTPPEPRLMADALRRLAEGASGGGWPVSYEATHHGPLLASPAFFVEIGYGLRPEPPVEAVRLLAKVLLELSPDPADRIALAIGGGHYAPHFTELARERRWAFGHILSRHAVGEIERATFERAFAQCGAAEGIVYARARDAEELGLESLGARLADSAAPRRDRSTA